MNALKPKRPPGRPTKPDAEKKLPAIGFRISHGLRDKLTAAAANNGGSLSAEIERRLDRTFAEDMTVQAVSGGLVGGMVELADVLHRYKAVRDGVALAGDDPKLWYKYMGHAPKGCSAADIAAHIEMEVRERMQQLREAFARTPPPREHRTYDTREEGREMAFASYDSQWLDRVEKTRAALQPGSPADDTTKPKMTPLPARKSGSGPKGSGAGGRKKAGEG